MRPKPKKKSPTPTGWLFVDQETNCFNIELEAQPDSWQKVCNFSWQLEATCENLLSPAKYVVAAVKFKKV